MTPKKRTLEDKLDRAEIILRYAFFIVGGVSLVAFMLYAAGVYWGMVK
ncbi:hypothetical protein ACYHK8_30730 (plasmid) [Pseudomonas amygdali pv. morsprunorum]|uniref:Hydroxyglutarate oxidase n=5 Tax=Pseudomonas syringae group TaxID=136849 RepID=A0A0Q0CDY7_PSEA0|nr:MULTISPECIES: hypothetical protein [Pseudomonas syringae group]EGH16734.1 hypothetical protein Pgy4_27240 [Pseudomonas savastanoi pv. glycinea str. race 4]KPZ09395.1 hypothetical protein ALO41_200181 [Pseudomonas amygdali pv. ulmi]KPZ33743.1 hypothetical protein AN901_205038 [Pseudomonas syringae pv. theae]MBI6727564.1 hypothetical protein [Pseudomonas amygdali]MBI6813422.1 hypothetical protein [Pseudomonas amygdali]